MGGSAHNNENFFFTPSRIFRFGLLGFLGGGTLALFAVADYAAVLFFCAIAASVLCTVMWRDRRVLTSALFLLLFLGGYERTATSLSRLAATNLHGTIIEGAASVVTEPARTERRTTFAIRFHQMDVRVLVSSNPFASVRYGDTVQARCVLETPKNFSDDFDYRMFLAKDGISYVCTHPVITTTDGSQKGKSFRTSLVALRTTMEDFVQRAIPQPHAALGSGLLFGGDDHLPDDVKKAFAATGMTHIVAVSGFNVTVIAHYLMLVGIALGLWRRHALFFAACGIGIFVIMIGFPQSAVRAGVMGLLVLFAMAHGRMSRPLNALLFAAALMLLINPLLLRYDIGFQLSFLATAGIVLLLPLYEHVMGRRRKITMRWLWDLLFVTISAQLFVMPLILYYFHTFSVISTAANILVLPIIPLTMLFVFLVAFLGIIPPLSLAFGWIAYLLLHYEIGVITFLASLPWASMTISLDRPGSVVVTYAILLSLVTLFRAIVRRKMFARMFVPQ